MVAQAGGQAGEHAPGQVPLQPFGQVLPVGGSGGAGAVGHAAMEPGAGSAAAVGTGIADRGGGGTGAVEHDSPPGQVPLQPSTGTRRQE